MSGSSNSSSGFDDWRPSGSTSKGGGGGSGDGGSKCAIYETTVLASPNSAVIANLKAGDVLTVGLETSPRNRVVVRTQAGEVAGAITSVNLLDLIDCMQNGHSYEAEIKAINGGKVDVEISPT